MSCCRWKMQHWTAFYRILIQPIRHVWNHLLVYSHTSKKNYPAPALPVGYSGASIKDSIPTDTVILSSAIILDNGNAVILQQCILSMSPPISFLLILPARNWLL